MLSLHVTGAPRGAGNAHSFRNTRFHSLWGVHDFTHSFYIHYILLHLSVLGLCLRINDPGLFAWMSLTALSLTYFIIALKERGKYGQGTLEPITSISVHSVYQATCSSV